MKLLDLIVCDDIRQEVGGKQSLIGVYSDLIINFMPGQMIWPLNFKLGIFIRLKLDDNDIKPDAFEIDCFYLGKIIKNFNGNLNFPENTKNFNLIMVDNAFMIQGVGHITFAIKFKKNNEVYNTIIPEYILEVKTSNLFQ